MRFLITSISGKKGYKSFKNLNEYVEFMTKKGHLVKNLKEADLPYTDKPVKLPKVSKSDGWSEVTDFGEVGEEAEKGESLIASTSKSVMKDEASFEMSKSSGKADKPEMGLGAEKGDVDMSDFKSFKYEEPKLKSSETKESTPKSEESKSEEKSKEDKKDSNESSKKEEKKDDSKKHDKDIEECLRAAGVQLKEGIKDYLPRAGFIRDDDEDKSSSKMGIWGGQGTDEEIRKAKIIAKVKFANGDRMGRVTGEDLKHFNDYKRQYDEIYGSNDELNEGEKWNKFKDGIHNLGVKAKQGLGIGMNDEVLESYGIGYLVDVFLAATKQIQPDDVNFQETANKITKTDSKMKNLHSKIMKFLQDKTYDEKFDPQMMANITRRFLCQIGIDEDIVNQAYEDYKEEVNKNIEESEDEMIDSDISECLKAAGVQLNEFFHFDGPDPDDESKESDDEKTYKKYMKKEISDDEARSELKKQGYKGKKAKNLVKNAKSKRDSK